MIDIGRPRPSTARWILLVSPPRDRPEGIPFDGKGFDPVGGAAPFLRAPAECWWARTLLESTLIVHSTAPTESSLTITLSSMGSHVPSAVHSRSRSWAVFHGP
jgi:hypothetical protein